MPGRVSSDDVRTYRLWKWPLHGTWRSATASAALTDDTFIHRIMMSCEQNKSGRSVVVAQMVSSPKEAAWVRDPSVTIRKLSQRGAHSLPPCQLPPLSKPFRRHSVPYVPCVPWPANRRAAHAIPTPALALSTPPSALLLPADPPPTTRLKWVRRRAGGGIVPPSSAYTRCGVLAWRCGCSRIEHSVWRWVHQ